MRRLQRQIDNSNSSSFSVHGLSPHTPTPKRTRVGAPRRHRGCGGSRAARLRPTSRLPRVHRGARQPKPLAPEQRRTVTAERAQPVAGRAFRGQRRRLDVCAAAERLRQDAGGAAECADVHDERRLRAHLVGARRVVGRRRRQALAARSRRRLRRRRRPRRARPARAAPRGPTRRRRDADAADAAPRNEVDARGRRPVEVHRGRARRCARTTRSGSPRRPPRATPTFCRSSTSSNTSCSGGPSRSPTSANAAPALPSATPSRCRSGPSSGRSGATRRRR